MKTHLLTLSPDEFCAATKACKEGADYAATQPNMAAVWDNCKRVEWMVWMLNAIEAKHDERAERLFAVWCARNTPLADGRKTGDLLTDPSSLAALEVAERYAHGRATADELAAARVMAWDAALAAAAAGAARAAAWAAAWAAAGAAAGNAAGNAAGAAWAAAGAAARAAQCKEFRRVIPNPFKP